MTNLATSRLLPLCCAVLIDVRIAFPCAVESDKVMLSVRLDACVQSIVTSQALGGGKETAIPIRARHPGSLRVGPESDSTR